MKKLFEMRHNEADTYLLGLGSSYSYAIIIEASTISAYNQQKTWKNRLFPFLKYLGDCSAFRGMAENRHPTSAKHAIKPWLGS